MNLANFCNPNDQAGFGARGVDKTVLMRCARHAVRARAQAVPVGLWTSPWSRANQVLREMFGDEVDGTSGEEIETAVSRLMLIDFLTGSKVIGLATRDEYREQRDRLPTPGVGTWLGWVWDRVKRTSSFYAQETSPEELAEALG